MFLLPGHRPHCCERKCVVIYQAGPLQVDGFQTHVFEILVQGPRFSYVVFLALDLLENGNNKRGLPKYLPSSG